MIRKVIGSQKYIDQRFGAVNVRAVSTARRVIARWKADVLHITIPTGMSLDEYNRITDAMAADILRMKEKSLAAAMRFAPGDEIASDLVVIRFTVDSTISASNIIQYGYSKKRDDIGRPIFAISFKAAEVFDDITTQERIKKAIAEIAHNVATVYLISEMRDVLKATGHNPDRHRIAISRGVGLLGRCTRGGDISLSCHLVLLPRELRHMVMTHEIAHLRHHDHSPAFYAEWQSMERDDVRTLRRRITAARRERKLG